MNTDIERFKKWSDFGIALGVAAIILSLFIALQKVGLIDLVQVGDISYGTAFVIGVVSSLSTCMAVVGGLLLSMSSTFAREGDRVRPQIYFHAGRLVAFFVLGGIIGAIGSALQPSPAATSVLGLIASVVMLLLGLNLLNVFPSLKRFHIRMPKSISSHALEVQKLNHSLTPFLVGIATFFLPCGFTQAMQIYTLTTGSFFSGAMTLFIYALGTLPMLAVLSFSSLSVNSERGRSIFFKAVGFIIIAFALLNIFSGLAAMGLIEPIVSL